MGFIINLNGCTSITTFLSYLSILFTILIELVPKKCSVTQHSLVVWTFAIVQVFLMHIHVATINPNIIWILAIFFMVLLTHLKLTSSLGSLTFSEVAD